MKKSRRKISLIVLFMLCCTVFGFIHTGNVSATESLQEKIIRFTDSDILDNDTITIRAFAANVKSGAYRNPQYLNGYPITDVIKKVIPIELFYTSGLHLYMGKEYGFVIYTYTNSNGIAYFSALTLIDFTVQNKIDNYGNPLKNKLVYRMETILQMFVETSNDQGQSPWTVFVPNSYIGTDLYLKNVLVSANLLNENERNENDMFYEKSVDEGDILTSANLNYFAVQDVVSSNPREFINWVAEYVITDTIEATSQAGIPIVSPIAALIDKSYSYYKDGSEFLNSVNEIYKQEQIQLSTTGSTLELETEFNTKGEQRDDPNYAGYSREIYFKQAEFAPQAYFVAGLNTGDDNGYVEFEVHTQGEPSNSRLVMSIGFEVMFSQVGEAFVAQDSGGSYNLYPVDYPQGHEPAMIFHTVSRKITLGDVDEIGESYTPAYLLDEYGYMLYSFTPDVLGKYKFMLHDDNVMMPGMRIHLFKSSSGQTNMDLDELVNLSREELLTHPLYLAHNAGSSYWSLEYEFMDLDEYYIMVTYSFDYQGGATPFFINKEFSPPSLQLGQASASFSLGSQTYKFFSYTPAVTQNFNIGVGGISNPEFAIYDGNLNEQIYLMPAKQTIECLFQAGHKYLIKVKNNGLTQSGNITISNGNTLEAIDDYELTKTYEKIYYKFTPSQFTGKYAFSSGNPSVTMTIFDNNKGAIPDINGYHLEKNNSYFIELKNETIYDYQAGTLTVSFSPQAIEFGNNSVQMVMGENTVMFTPEIGMTYEFSLSSGKNIKAVYRYEAGETNPYYQIWTGNSNSLNLALEEAYTYYIILDSNSNGTYNLAVNAASILLDTGNNIFGFEIINENGDVTGRYSPDISGRYEIIVPYATNLHVFNLDLIEIYGDSEGVYTLYGSETYFIVINYSTIFSVEIDIGLVYDDTIIMYKQYNESGEINNYQFIATQERMYKIIAVGINNNKCKIELLDSGLNIVGSTQLLSTAVLNMYINQGIYTIVITTNGGSFYLAVEHDAQTLKASVSSADVYYNNLSSETEVFAGGIYVISIISSGGGGNFYPDYAFSYSVSNGNYAEIEGNYLRIKPTASYNVTFTLSVSYFNGSLVRTIRIVNAFNFADAIQLESTQYDTFMAYVINASSYGYNNFVNTATVNVYSNSQLIYSYTNQTFSGNKLVVNLIDRLWLETFTVTTEVRINTDMGYYVKNLSGKGITYNKGTFSSSTSLQYDYEFYNITGTYTNKKITVPSNVKILNMDSNNTNITGIYFEIQSRTTPLIFNIKNLYFTAPTNTTAITSYGDLVINCSGTNRFYGGEGIVDGFYIEEDGNPGIEIHNNNLIINGSTLYVYGGKGANQSNYQDFYNIDPAGNGGTAIECYNVFFNINYIYIKGGNGGNGGHGRNGVDGADGSGYKSNGKDGADGSDGTNGSYGGDAGHGGMGLWILGNSCVIASSTFNIYGGTGGNGGRGGNGGAGGDGVDGKGGQLVGTAGTGGNGGDGGYAGMGGDYGTGMIAFNEYDINKVINLSSYSDTTLLNKLLTWASNGTAGVGGTGGSGGKRGIGGTNFWGTKAPNGYNGTTMPNGGSGGNPNPHV